MGTLHFPIEKNSQEMDEFEGISKECKQILLSLPRVIGWRTPYLYLFQGFWCQPKEIQAIMMAQTHFEALDNDVMVATVPKSGTTWLKALVFAVVNRNKFDIGSKTHPLLTSNPHDLVPFLEYKVYANNQFPNLLNIPSPRLFSSHVPYNSLPRSIVTSKCKVVYICRNPYDTFVSIWHFLKKIRPTCLGPFSLEEAFDMYCKGHVGYGPYWDHMLQYWEESIRAPEKVMFLKYEDLKSDVSFQLRKLADFLGYPFTAAEEENGVVDAISKLCSFDQMKDLEVNKKGKSILYFENQGLFRKGEVGDWMNLLSVEMVERLSRIMEQKLDGSELQFPSFNTNK
ncbi:cytosolic sulfotransferase 15-like [Silene latifolia]|uniref:cytosolic sulfotransferase 15-like n=1 Tax=Silene latifolia TaxID=37657 RepID=UPI003D78089C